LTRPWTAARPALYALLEELAGRSIDEMLQTVTAGDSPSASAAPVTAPPRADGWEAVPHFGVSPVQQLFGQQSARRERPSLNALPQIVAAFRAQGLQSSVYRQLPELARAFLETHTDHVVSGTLAYLHVRAYSNLPQNDGLRMRLGEAQRALGICASALVDGSGPFLPLLALHYRYSPSLFLTYDAYQEVIADLYAYGVCLPLRFLTDLLRTFGTPGPDPTENVSSMYSVRGSTWHRWYNRRAWYSDELRVVDLWSPCDFWFHAWDYRDRQRLPWSSTISVPGVPPAPVQEPARALCSSIVRRIDPVD
jgi:hypothetical protein